MNLCVCVFLQGLQITSEIKDIDSLMRLSGRMECESPNRHLYEFVGNIRLDGHRWDLALGVWLPAAGQAAAADSLGPVGAGPGASLTESHAFSEYLISSLNKYKHLV